MLRLMVAIFSLISLSGVTLFLRYYQPLTEEHKVVSAFIIIGSILLLFISGMDSLCDWIYEKYKGDDNES